MLADYVLRDGKMYLTHSEVPGELRGQGIGKRMLENTFEYIQEHNIKAVAIWSFIETVANRSEKGSKIIQ